MESGRKAIPGRETATTKVQRCVDLSVWERKGRSVWEEITCSPRRVQRVAWEITFKITKASRFYGAIKPGKGA